MKYIITDKGVCAVKVRKIYDPIPDSSGITRMPVISKSYDWEVYSYHFEGSPDNEVADNILFGGTISDCFAWIQLMSDDLIG